MEEYNIKASPYGVELTGTGREVTRSLFNVLRAIEDTMGADNALEILTAVTGGYIDHLKRTNLSLDKNKLIKELADARRNEDEKKSDK